MISFESTKQGYANLWDRAKLTHPNDAKKQAERIIANQAVFQQVEDATDVPWWLVGCWLYRESNIDLNTYLGNGQSLHRVTTVVPAGRGPFGTFLEGAIDAIRLEKLYKLGKAAWTLEFCLYATEKLNGFGYFSKDVNSPYVWSWTDQYTSGKYVADGQFDRNFRDPQGGVAAIMMALFELGVQMPSRIAKEKPMVDVPTPAPTPASAPVPTPVVQTTELAQLVKTVESVIGFVPIIAKFFPPLAPVIPFIPLIKGGLDMLIELQGASHSPQTIADVIIKHLGNVKNDVQQIKSQIDPGGQNTTGG